MSEIFCPIMAGGRGGRLWPKSRKDKPKKIKALLARLASEERFGGYL